MPAVIRCLLLITTLLSLSTATHAAPIDSFFVYQGVLEDGGAPANGTYDIQYRLFNDAGVPVSILHQFNGIVITDGLVNQTLPWSTAHYNGEKRFLEIALRKSGDPTFTTLAPRTEIRPTPYASHAIEAETSLDNEWSRAGSVISAGDSADKLLFNQTLTAGSMLNSFTNLQLNFDNPSFGGIYINSQNSGGAPFYGFAHDNIMAAFMEYRQSDDQIRFINSGGLLPTLTLGNTTATAPILAAENEIVKDFGSSEFHRNGPIAYGVFSFDGSKLSGTPNISAVWDGGVERYLVSVDGESLHFISYTAVVTPSGTSSPVLATTDSFSGNLSVYLFNLAGTKIQNRFSIVIYENAAVTVD